MELTSLDGGIAFLIKGTLLEHNVFWTLHGMGGQGIHNALPLSSLVVL